MDMIYNICLILSIIGAINWGCIGFFNFDLVAAIAAGGGKFGNISMISRFIYAAVGLAGLFVAIYMFM